MCGEPLASYYHYRSNFQKCLPKHLHVEHAENGHLPGLKELDSQVHEQKHLFEHRTLNKLMYLMRFQIQLQQKLHLEASHSCRLLNLLLP